MSKTYDKNLGVLAHDTNKYDEGDIVAFSHDHATADTWEVLGNGKDGVGPYLRLQHTDSGKMWKAYEGTAKDLEEVA